MAADGVFPEHDPDQAEAEEGGEGRASYLVEVLTSTLEVA